MSVYSTIDLSETEAIQLIARHLNLYEYGDQLPKTRTQILSDILFELTYCNPFTPLRWCNYFVYADDDPILATRLDPMQYTGGEKISDIIKQF